MGKKTVLLAKQQLSKDSSLFKSPTSFFGGVSSCFEMFGTNGIGFICLTSFESLGFFYINR